MSLRLSWQEARLRAELAGRALPAESVPLADGVGRRLAADLAAPYDLPHFASSAMDGWLVVGPGPWTITDAVPRAGQARAVVTGEAIPRGLPETSTAVLRSERADVSSGTIRSISDGEPRPGQHVRAAGAEAARGETLIRGGTRLNPAHLALAASAGLDSVLVRPVPEVALVLTGSEIVAHGVPGPGFVRDSFSVPLPALLELLGARRGSAMRVGDDPDAITSAIRRSSAPLVVTTGGTGGSSVDHLRSSVGRLGGRLIVDGIAMRPGGPTIVAELPDGRLVACLPGNPLAAMVAAITICEPLVAGLSGRPMRPTRPIAAIDLPGRDGSTLLVPYSVADAGAVPTPWAGSGMMRGLAIAEGLLVIPGQGIHRGGMVESIDLPWVRPASL